jgi:hypothetical protein
MSKKKEEEEAFYLEEKDKELRFTTEEKRDTITTDDEEPEVSGKSQLQQKEDLHDILGGTIGTSDFTIWTVMPIIGILFCLLHSEQEHLWQWTGPTAKDAQTLKAKIVVSIMSFIIGGCFVATLMKTVTGLSFAYMKFRGAHFSQVVTMIGGYTATSSIPLLAAGQQWFNITVIMVVAVVSVITKQLAVVSMEVNLVTANETILSFTPNYTACLPLARASSVTVMTPVIGMTTFNTLLNPNTSYTNEYYDRGIPAGLQGISNFERVLPFADVSCTAFTLQTLVGDFTPNITSMGSLWAASIVVPLHDENPKLMQYVNCTIKIGQANAFTSCNDTLCYTNRTSDITPYSDKGYGAAGIGAGVKEFLANMFTMMTPFTSIARNQLVAWLLGGSLTDYYAFQALIPGESVQVIQDRTEILATVVGRILCDYNNGTAQDSTTPITSLYQFPSRYVYGILWKWPFYFVAGLLCLLWMICMFNLRMTPETRLISVEWLLSQYLNRNRKTYMSGAQLVRAYGGSGLLFQVKEKYAADVGNDYAYIAIDKTTQYGPDIRDLSIQNRKIYA